MQHIEVSCSILRGVAQRFGLELNLAAGETEAVVVLAGAGATKARHLLAASCQELAADEFPALPRADGGGIRFEPADNHSGVKVSALEG